MKGTSILAIGIIERQKIYPIPFGQWIKSGVIVSIPTLALVTRPIDLQFYI